MLENVNKSINLVLKFKLSWQHNCCVYSAPFLESSLRDSHAAVNKNSESVVDKHERFFSMSPGEFKEVSEGFPSDTVKIIRTIFSKTLDKVLLM